MTMPLISIIMPVYNAGAYLKEAINSILKQTYTNFEFIIANDGSNDKSVSIIKSFNDRRIIFFNFNENKGYICRLNFLISKSCGKYVARMDADDISEPDRFNEQIKLLENNKNIGIVGSWARIMNNSNILLRYPTRSNNIQTSLLFNNPFCHPTVIMRKKLLTDHNLLYKSLSPTEDLDLWQRCIGLTQMANISKPLLKYRIHATQTSKIKSKEQSDNLFLIRKELYSKLRINLEKKEYNVFNFLNNTKKITTQTDFVFCTDFIEQITEANNKYKIFDNKSLIRVISLQLLIISIKSRSIQMIIQYLTSRYAVTGIYSGILFYLGLL